MTKGIPDELKPLIVGIAGYGNVSQGAQEVLNFLPIKEIEPAKLSEINDNENVIYKVVFKEENLVRHTKEVNLISKSTTLIQSFTILYLTNICHILPY